MSAKIKNPNESNKGFIVGVVALIAIVVIVVGVVMYIGRNQPIEGLPDEDVNLTVSLDGDAITLQSPDAGDDAVTAVLYEDVSCHVCADMATQSHSDQLAALENGDLITEFRPVVFLDQGADGHSTRATAVLRLIAENEDAKLFWNFHTLLMEDQSTAMRWDWNDMADRLEAMDADSSIVDQVREGLDLEATKAASDVNVQGIEALNDGQVATPALSVNGESLMGIVGNNLGSWVMVALEVGQADGAGSGADADGADGESEDADDAESEDADEDTSSN